MALTLVEAAKLAVNNGEDKKAGVLMTFVEASPLLKAIPIVPIQGNSYTWNETQVLPTAAFRGVNEGYTANEGKILPRVETLKILGGDLDVDRAIIKTNGMEVRTVHERLKAVAMAQQMGYSLVQGDASTNPKSVEGLASRFAIGGTRALANGAAAMSFKNLDTAIQMVDNPTHLLMPKKQRVNMTAFLRSSGTSVFESRREFGQLIYSYQGLDILDADVNGDTAALAYNEASSTCSIFVLNLSTSGVHLIENGGVMVEDMGQLQTAPVYRTRVEWLAGLVNEGPRCAARLSGVTDATAVA